jgi:hypothetical protein
MAQHKIIQIAVAVTPGSEYSGADDRESFYALCDDGKLWLLVWEDPDDGSLPAVTRWKQMPNVPQPGDPQCSAIRAISLWLRKFKLVPPMTLLDRAAAMAVAPPPMARLSGQR